LSGTPPATTTPGRTGADLGGRAEFAEKVGQKVAPPFFNAFDDPLTSTVAKVRAFGAYAADDEGVPAQRVSLIKDGMLEGLYMSRTPGKKPREKLAQSNGHGRGITDAGAVRGGPGVLVVSAGKQAVADAQLTKRALQEAAGAMPVYVVRILATGSRPRPVVIERVGPGGKLEPVRGVSFTNLAPRSLKDIVAMGRTPYVYNYLSARLPVDGGAPATLVAPALVIRDVEIGAELRAHTKPPLYPHPFFPALSQR
jgi:TldD protein